MNNPFNNKNKKEFDEFDNKSDESDDSWSNSVLIDEDIDTSSSDLASDSSDSTNSSNLSNSNDNSLISPSTYNFKKLESFESKLPKDIPKEKKMSLLIVVLLQMVFNNNNEKLNNIYKFLNKKNILDIEVTSNSYSGIRSNLSFMIESLNNFTSEKSLNNLEVENNTGKDKQKYINKYRNNYNEIKLIGKGGYGSVYKVFHIFEKKFYAIKKIFIIQDLISENYNIFNEIQLYSGLTHPNIVRYYSSWVDIDLNSIIDFNKSIDILEDDPINSLCPILFIQMELCDLTIKEYFLTKFSEDPLETKLNYFKQIVLGIDYLHENNLIHRDIKPENIFMVTNSSNSVIIKIGDFGLSTIYPKNNKLIELKDNKDNKYNELINLVENNHLQLEFSNKNNEEKINLESDLVSDSDSDYEFGQLINLSVDVGTGIYKAKEIDTGHYSNSVDIYSLGVLLIEFLIEFKTIHEKIIKLKDINNAISTSKPIPHLITNKYDNLIITMTNDNPVIRPNTKSILTLL